MADNSGWKELDLDNLKDSEEEIEIEIVSEEEAEEEQAADKDKDKEAEKEEQKSKRPSRAKERIHQLVQEKKTLAAKLQELEAALSQNKEQESLSKKENIKVQVSLLDSNIEATKRELTAALQEGNHELVADLQDRLADYKVDKRILEAQSSKIPPAATAAKEEPKARQELPEEMQAWFEVNQWAIAPKTAEERAKVRKVRKITKALLDDGFSEMEPEFYEELDARLEEEFASSGDSVVESNQEDSTPPQTRAVNKSANSSRSSSGSPRGGSMASSSKKGKVVLTASEREFCQRMGIDEVSYAKRKQAIEARKSEEDSKWTTVV